MKTEIFKLSEVSEDNQDNIRINTFLASGLYIGLKPVNQEVKTEVYRVNHIVQRYVIDCKYDKNQYERERLLNEGFKPVGRDLRQEYYERVRRIVIDDPMLNKFLSGLKFNHDEYLTQNLELQSENSRLEYKFELERAEVIKLKENIRTLGFFSRIFRWKKFVKNNVWR